MNTNITLKYENTENYNMIPCTIQKHIVNNPSRFISNSNSCHQIKYL